MREAVSEILSILIIVAICSSVVVSYLGSCGTLNVSSPENLSVVSAKVSGQVIVVYLYNFGGRDAVVDSAYVNDQPVPNFVRTTVPKNGMASVTLQIPPGVTAPYSFTLKTLEGSVVNGVAS